MSHLEGMLRVRVLFYIPHTELIGTLLRRGLWRREGRQPIVHTCVAARMRRGRRFVLCCMP